MGTTGAVDLTVAMDMTAVLVGFARTLRQAGLAAGARRTQAMLAAAEVLGVTEASGVYWAGRLTMCAGPDDLPVYDAAFAAYFGARRTGSTPQPPTIGGDTAAGGHAATGGHAAAGGSVVAGGRVASSAELLRQRDIAELTSEERAEVSRLVALLAAGTAPRPGRRRRPARVGPVDLPRTVRQMLRQAGEPVRLARRVRRSRPRRLVLLVDVSGSMAPYADVLLRFGHAAVRRHPTLTEVFTIGTRLTRVTRALRHRDPDTALTEAGHAIPDWHGGTRLAGSVGAFLDRWGRRGTARGAVVVLCSDGWERGDPAALGARVAQLSRLAHRLVWVNPHRGRPGYQPLAAGMAAALPYLDDFVAGHSLAALAELAQVIARA